MSITAALLTLQVILTILIVIVVLLQKSSSIGLGAYSGSNESIFGAKGPAGFIAKFTMFLGLLFVINTIALGYFYNKASQKSVLDNVELPTQPSTTSDDINKAFEINTDSIPQNPLIVPEAPVSE